MFDVREIVRRLRLLEPDRRIARDLEISRNTVSRYRAWAEAEGLLDPESELADAAEIAQRLAKRPCCSESGPASSLDPWLEVVVEMRRRGVELVALHRLLVERGFTGSYSALRRFVRRVEGERPKEVFLRVEVGAGEEAQVDFGYVGLLFDPRTKRMRKAWVFVMTLSFSRHQYAEIVFDQRVETWIELHVRAFESFGGVPRRAVIDNLRAGIVKAVLHDQEAQRSYRELAEHYGFLIAPCRPRTPRHKGKVESGVHYVKRNALAGRDFTDIDAANRHLARWVTEVAGVRDHGTTHEPPLARFELEREKLLPLPGRRYEAATWKRLKVHSDVHVAFDYSWYSVPHRFVGETAWLRATARRVEIFVSHERVATHERASTRGEWKTLPNHLPPGKLEGLLPEPALLKALAIAVGPCTTELVERLLGDRPMDRLRGAQAVLRLGKRFGPSRLEAACRRALAFDQVGYRTVKGILRNDLDLVDPAAPDIGPGPLPKTSRFARSAAELVPAAAISGDRSWT